MGDGNTGVGGVSGGSFLVSLGFPPSTGLEAVSGAAAAAPAAPAAVVDPWAASTAAARGFLSASSLAAALQKGLLKWLAALPKV